MKADAYQRTDDGMSIPRANHTPTTHAQDRRSQATGELQRVNRIFIAVWGSLVAVLLVIALSTASYGQVQLACRGYSAEALAPASRAIVEGIVGETVPPSPTNLEAVKAKIRYPRSAAAQGHQGLVSAELLVSETGQVLQYNVDGAAAPQLKQAVAEHLFDLRFEPAQRDGRAIRMYVTIPFAFRIL